MIVVAGGSFMALHDLRDSTRDVDTISDIHPDLRAPVEDPDEYLIDYVQRIAAEAATPGGPGAP